MKKTSPFRFTAIALVLLLGVWWALASAAPNKPGYPNQQFLVTASELMQLQEEQSLVIVDVRTDEHFDGNVIPGAIRMPWSLFRHDDPARNMGGLFVGPAEAQRILGKHGLFRNDMIVLYDSVARDGGATASYLFWVLDLLGHQQKAILERGVDGWLDAGGEIVNQADKREPLLYQAPSKEIEMRRWADEGFIYPRLGDPYYQILDVRSADEYSGQVQNTGLDDSPLKAGHIPGAVNINYEDNWVDPESKDIKGYAELADMYRGLSPTRGVITYCHSARRGSFSYFILRLLGFEDVMLYDNSWFGWGRQDLYYPVETAAHVLSGGQLPDPAAAQDTSGSQRTQRPQPASGNKAPEGNTGSSSKGYISCGG